MRLNLSEAVRTWSIRRGEELAISGSRKMSYSELNSVSDLVSYSIMSLLFDFKSPVRIAILTKDNIKFVYFLLGIIRSGNIFVLINPTLSYKQINRSLCSVQCDYYLSDKKQEEISAQFIPILAKKECGYKHEQPFLNTGVCDEAGVIFSSGTTGEPKALMRSSFSVLSEAIQWMVELQLKIGTSFLIPRPLYYTGGFILMYATLFSGGRVDLLDSITFRDVLDYTKTVCPDWAFIVPSVIREMIAHEDHTYIAKQVLTMGSPIFCSEKKAFREKYKCNVIEVWGNSEGLGTITDPQDLYDRPNSIGRPFFTDYLDIWVDDTYPKVGKHADGIIFGVSDNEFSEYIGQPTLTEHILHNGFIFSEDIGYKDENGYFYLTGRVKDIIVVDGIKVFPTDIEEELMKESGVIDCAVFGLTNDKGNDAVAVAIVLKKNVSAAETIQAVNARLAPHEKITNYICLKIIPRNHGGKVDRNAIVAQIDDFCEVY